MKKLMFSFAMACVSIYSQAENNLTIEVHSYVTGSIEIKIKNDLGDEVRVYNAGSGGSYSLTKGATTTIKMDEGDKLYYYNNGKKGELILTATADMNGKVQLLSKL